MSDRRRRGRPKRQHLPAEIGQYPDDVVAALETERGRPITKSGIGYLRRSRGIPAAPPSTRRRNQYDREP